MRVFLHGTTPASKPDIVTYSFLINAALTLPDDIRNSGVELQCLELCDNPAMSCEGLGSIVESILGYEIQALDLSFNPQLGDSMIAAIQPLLEAQRSPLTDLKLAKCGLTVTGLEWLVKVAKKSRLRLLDISCIQLRDETELIEQVLELPMIEHLVFRYCHLGPEEVRTIAEGLPFTSIKSLNLAGNTFRSEGLAHLASKLSESSVVELDLSGTGIEGGCEGLSQLAKAWVERPFSKLCLKNNAMTQEGILNFITTLRTLMLVNDDCGGLALVDSLWDENSQAGCC